LGRGLVQTSMGRKREKYHIEGIAAERKTGRTIKHVLKASVEEELPTPVRV